MNNLDLYYNRMSSVNGISRDSLIDNKIKTFKKALNRSYNSEIVYAEDGRRIRALISSIPTSPIIRKKNFSTLLDNDCSVGDVLLWEREETHWIVTEHDDGEPAVFQGSIQECIYNIKWRDPKSNRIYETWAAAKGPEETTITNGVKHSIFFDRLTDSLYLIIPKHAEGVDLLRRYFQIMVNGVKWEIEIADFMTRENLVYLDLKQVLKDEERDSEDLVDGKIDNAFKVTTILDNISEIELGTKFVLIPVLTHKGTVIKDEFEIRVTNASSKDNLITFDKLGKTTILIQNEKYAVEKKIEIETVAVKEEKETIKEIVGSSNLKTLTSAEFTFIFSIDGVEQKREGVWSYDTDYFLIEEEDRKAIKLKTRNKTGTTTITYTDNGDVYTHKVKIIPLFGG